MSDNDLIRRGDALAIVSRWDTVVSLQARIAALAPAQPAHTDDLAVDRFAAAMKAKLADARAKGRGGWDDPDRVDDGYLAELLRGRIGKGNAGNFEDIANLAMMLHQRGANPAVLITSAQPAPDALTEVLADLAAGQQPMDLGITEAQWQSLYERDDALAQPTPSEWNAAIDMVAAVARANGPIDEAEILALKRGGA